jgi:hypothetical protein
MTLAGVDADADGDDAAVTAVEGGGARKKSAVDAMECLGAGGSQSAVRLALVCATRANKDSSGDGARAGSAGGGGGEGGGGVAGGGGATGRQADR